VLGKTSELVEEMAGGAVSKQLLGVAEEKLDRYIEGRSGVDQAKDDLLRPWVIHFQGGLDEYQGAEFWLGYSHPGQGRKAVGADCHEGQVADVEVVAKFDATHEVAQAPNLGWGAVLLFGSKDPHVSRSKHSGGGDGTGGSTGEQQDQTLAGIAAGVPEAVPLSSLTDSSKFSNFTQCVCHGQPPRILPTVALK
jgi:hypothetical protein